MKTQIKRNEKKNLSNIIIFRRPDLAHGPPVDKTKNQKAL